jgi:hypothetical protein
VTSVCLGVCCPYTRMSDPSGMFVPMAPANVVTSLRKPLPGIVAGGTLADGEVLFTVPPPPEPPTVLLPPAVLLLALAAPAVVLLGALTAPG